MNMKNVVIHNHGAGNSKYKVYVLTHDKGSQYAYVFDKRVVFNGVIHPCENIEAAEKKAEHLINAFLVSEVL